MLNEAIHRAFAEGVAARRDDSRVTPLGRGAPDAEVERAGVPELFRVAAADLGDELLEECFGPTALVVEYADTDDLIDTLSRLEGQLTATVHATDDEAELAGLLHQVVRRLAGRIVFDGYPTGVAVSWATHHGGPYPATTSVGHTSVGTAAIRRWLRPISYQNAPHHVLAPELRDDNPTGIPRRLNGRRTS